jgi:endonuclease/exonuclease/phosphatase family metal-dependent hydrolase
MIKLMISSSGIATLTLTFFVYIVYMLAAIWVVAYNFVPIGGTVAREQTGPLMAVVLVGVGLPLFLHQKSEESDKKGNNKDNGQDAMKKKMFPHGMKTVLVLLVAIGLMGMGNRYYHKHYTNTKSDHPRDFTAMIWTIHFAYDNNGWPSFERIASLINNTEADVIGLLETDASRPFLHNHDIAMWLEERLGLYADFGPATRDHTWGSMLLSKHQIVKSKHHLLPSPEGELAPAISATVNIRGNEVNFLIVHMGNDVDDLDRQLQAQELATILTDFENPAVFLGYVTSEPGSRDYKKLLSGEEMKVQLLEQ